ncbi:hypothetical protein, partial [Celeribacter persicus]|uniref:hypothetical protein n=1 Tax=Celeribacter persicus TaxID=1651082 RepID=UPI001B88061B
AARREKVDDFYAARTVNTTALPWSNFAPPFSAARKSRRRFMISPTHLLNRRSPVWQAHLATQV